MKVKCIEAVGSNDLTVGQIYDATIPTCSCHPAYYVVDKNYYCRDRFIKVDESLPDTLPTIPVAQQTSSPAPKIQPFTVYCKCANGLYVGQCPYHPIE